MIDTTGTKKDFLTLDHKTKVTKLKKILENLSKKSPLFAKLHNHFAQQKDIQENALDAMYAVVMNIAAVQQK